ncbi:MAG: LicD family protein [Oscillospiraceae bacterium]|nr:LicD family protein [Oscillospiraceae bacterium]
MMSVLQLDIMDEVHRMCVKHGITYYIIAGTLLGAVRHKGFIPWDLDIDIAMPRQDYERFKEVALAELPEKYSYLNHENCSNYFRPHALVVRNDTRVHLKYDQANPKMFDLGVYIDIFPLDSAPDNEKLREKQAKKLKRIRQLIERRIPYCYSFKRWRRYIHYAVSFLLSWISVRKLNRYQQKLMKKYSDGKTACLCSMASQYAYAKQCMPVEIYGTPTLLDFEGRQYYAPEKYTEYLTRLYGDYMQLPPIEKRQANLKAFTSIEQLS